MGLRVGISSTFIEEAARDGVRTIIESVRLNGGTTPFILSTREKGEYSVTDGILDELANEGIPLICVSTARHKREGKKDWRQNWGQEALDKVSRFLPVDLVFLFGDMTVWPENMCRELSGVNLHPDLPGRFKGEWYEAIAQIVKNKSEEAGVMIHLVSSELDQGPVLTYCRFSLEGGSFGLLRESLPTVSEELARFMEQQRQLKENPSHSLWREIRRQGLAREFALIRLTLAALAEGKIKIEGQKALDEFGWELLHGLDLTSEIEEIVRPVLEGKFSGRNEARF